MPRQAYGPFSGLKVVPTLAVLHPRPQSRSKTCYYRQLALAEWQCGDRALASVVLLERATPASQSATWSGEYLARVRSLAASRQVREHMAAVCGTVGFAICMLLGGEHAACDPGDLGGLVIQCGVWDVLISE
jgi:hypothetical protein